jgi:hypothetical protein
MKKLNQLFYSVIDTIAFKCDLRRRAEKANRRGARYGSMPLTKEEKFKIETIWGKWGGNYDVFGFYKKFCGFFDPNFVPDDYYDFAEHVLNLRWSAYFLQHKCNLKYILPKQNRAEVIVQKIDGHYVLEDNTEISKKDAINILKKENAFIAKIARGTGGGRGVRKIIMDDIQNKDEFLNELLSPIDMEFERIISQNDFFAQFNPDSVNTMRMVTLNINEKCTVLSAFLRMGSKGSFVDNFCSGVGVLAGINYEGYLNEFGIDKNFDKVFKAPTGLEFKGVCIPNYDSVKQQIIDFHRKIPFANLIGWDVTLDKDSNPIVIEVNLDSAHLALHQAFNGPIFGERLNEVMEYINTRTPLLHHQMMTY